MTCQCGHSRFGHRHRKGDTSCTYHGCVCEHFTPADSQPKYSAEELKKWWPAVCPKCGWCGLSRDAAGGEPMADTGDYNDVLCPVCIKSERFVPVEATDPQPDQPAGGEGTPSFRLNTLAEWAERELGHEGHSAIGFETTIIEWVKEAKSRLTTLEREKAELQADLRALAQVAKDKTACAEQAEARVRELEAALDAVCDLINESTGVAGLHLNGDIAKWEDLRAGGKYEEWLLNFDKALETLKGPTK